MTKPKQGEIYRHHSGKLYSVIRIVYDANTGDELVAYQEVKKETRIPDMQVPKIWIHTVENFNKKGRFERVK